LGQTIPHIQIQRRVSTSPSFIAYSPPMDLGAPAALQNKHIGGHR
jgi:hypothetical protein